MTSSCTQHVWLRLLFAAVCVGGCAPEPTGPREGLCAGSGCSDDCRALEVERCDIRDAECQKVVFKSVRCVRGSGLTNLPPTTFVPQSTFTDDRRDAAQGQADLAAQIWGAYVDDGLRELRLIDEGTTLAEANAAEGEATGGVQQSGTVQISEDEGYASWWAMRLLAHEYVHAQQDHDYGGLDRLYRKHARSNATSQGIQAYVEGEAELYAWLTHAFMRGVNPEPWRLDEFFELEEKGLRSRVSQSASPWTPARQWQHYAIGARHLHRVWQQGHNLAVRGVLHNLDPDFGAWTSGFAPRLGPKVSRDPVCSPVATQLMLRDNLGPSGVFALLMAATAQQPVSPVEEAWELAVQLTEDQLQMYAPVLTQGISQAQWLAEAATSAMCASSTAPGPLSDSDAAVGPPRDDSGLIDAEGGLGDAASGDASGDAASGDAASSPVTDAGAARTPVPMSDAGVEYVDPNDPRTRLVPGGAVWVSWAFGFESPDAAQRFASLVAALPHLRVELAVDRVILRATRQSQRAALLSKWQTHELCTAE